MPAGIYAIPSGKGNMEVKAFIASPDGKELYRAENTGTIDAAESLGSSIAEKLLDAGGRQILETLQKI